jgi:arylamine N-acetyltransferase
VTRHGGAVDGFVEHFAIQPRLGRDALLEQIGSAFAQLPYENLTKLIRKFTEPPGPSRRRTPDDVVSDHIQLGTGGTCFALSTLFREVLRRFGFECFVALCDSRRAVDSHCALVVTLDGTPHLVDPGYLVYRPLPMRAGQVSQHSGSAALQLVGDPSGQSFELSSGGRPRYRVKNAPIGERQLLALWDESFDWTMMNNVHICQARADGYAYLHGRKLRHQGRRAKSTQNVREMLPAALGERFGIDPRIVEQAYGFIDEIVRGSHTGGGSG